MQTIEANGARIPLLGLGTWELRGNVCARIVEQAIKLGYRHIDTAQSYDNEKEVGEAVRASGVRRNEIFVTTKVWPTAFRARDFARTTRESLARLRMPEVDLLLLHWPNQEVPLAETIGALCKAKTDGLARHIGISNFNVARVEEAVKLSTEPLVCNQIEYHPFLDQTKVIAACRKHGLAVVAYSPIARGRAVDNPVLAEIGKAHGKSAAQVSLRWLVQREIVVIPRTAKVERLSSNAAIFDFTLSDDEMARISALARPDGRIVNFSFGGPPDWD